MDFFSPGVQQSIIWFVAGILILILLIVCYFGVKTESVRKIKKESKNRKKKKKKKESRGRRRRGGGGGGGGGGV